MTGKWELLLSGCFDTKSLALAWMESLRPFYFGKGIRLILDKEGRSWFVWRTMIESDFTIDPKNPNAPYMKERRSGDRDVRKTVFEYHWGSKFMRRVVE